MLNAVHPTVEVLDYSLTEHAGAVEIDGQTYEVRRVGKTTVQLSRIDSRRGRGVYTVNVRPYQCNCPDAVYQPTRPGGCKHVVALRDHVEPALRRMRCEIAEAARCQAVAS